MERTAVFVDAGHVFAAGSILLTGKVLKRGELDLDQEKFLAFLRGRVVALTGLPLLRIYWYDGTASGPTPFQLALAYLPDVKLRLGLVNTYGQQKGVDSLIVTDLINLSRNRAMTSAILITGDEDIRVGVMQAQEYGVRVHLTAIAPARFGSISSGVSSLLMQEADTYDDITKEEVEGFLTARPYAPSPEIHDTRPPVELTKVSEPAPISSVSSDEQTLGGSEPAETRVETFFAVEASAAVVAPSAPAAVAPVDLAEQVITVLMPQLTASDISLVARGSARIIPNSVDRQLLAVASKRLGLNPLPEDVRQRIRRLLFETCQKATQTPGT